LNSWLKKMLGRTSSDIIEESRRPSKLGIEPVCQCQGPYEVYSDDNYDKEGISQRHVGTYSSLEEAVHSCQKIVGNSVGQSTAYCTTPEDIVRNWQFGGATAYIRGSNAFSAEAYAEQAAQEMCSNQQKAY